MSVAPTVPTGALAAHATQVRALPVLLLGAFLAVLDFFVVNVALPSIGTSLGASASGLELVVAGYGVGLRLHARRRRPPRRPVRAPPPVRARHRPRSP